MKPKRLLISFFVGMLALLGTYSMTFAENIDDELVVKNTGETFVLPRDFNVRQGVKSVEPSLPRTNVGKSLNKQTALPDDIGFPLTPDGFDYSELTDNLDPFTRSIIKPDTRSKVNNPNLFPYRASCLVIVDFKNSKGQLVRGHGSGSLVGKNKVVTNAHVLYSLQYGWADTVRVYPAIKNNYTDYDMAYGSEMTILNAYITNNGTQYSRDRDVATIKLNWNLGDTTGWYGYTTANQNYVRINGYDGDIDEGRSMVTRYGYTNFNNARLEYKMSSYPGASGSGVYNPNTNMLEGIHAYGYGTHNGGPNINSMIYDFIKTN